MIKLLKIFLIVIIILIVILGVIKMEQRNNERIVIIIDGKIENENLIDEFINDTSRDTQKILKILEKEDENETNIEITFIPKEVTKMNNENTWYEVSIPETNEEYQKEYGYYIISINGEEKARYDALRWQIKRTTQYGKVTLYFNTIADVTEYSNICEYDLEGSNYVQKFEITYNQRKDLGIKTIVDKDTSDQYDYNVCTFVGDVTITVNGDMVYSLEDALNQNIITAEDILEQARTDEKYGLCEEGYYLDGGSTEYLYSDYTILKCNTLDGNKNLYIGMKGQILSQINKIENNNKSY